MSERSSDEKRAEAPLSGDGAAKPFPEFILAPPEAIGAGPAAELEVPDFAARPGTRGAGPAAAPPPASTSARLAAPARPPRARGVRLAAACALVALIGAGATIAAPSLRPLLADALRQQFGERPWIAVVTGTAEVRPPQLVEIDLQRFDQRLSALATALSETPAGAPVDRETLKRFVDATSQGERLAVLDGALHRSEEQVASLQKALAGLEAGLSQIGARTAQLETADHALTARLETAEAGARDAAARTAALDGGAVTAAGRIEKLSAAVAELGAGIAALTARLDAADRGLAELTAASQATAQADREAAAGRFGALESATAELATRVKAADASAAAAIAKIATVEAAVAEARAQIAQVDGELDGAVSEAGRIDQALVLTGSRVDAVASGVQALGDRVSAVDAKIPAVAPAAGPVLLALAGRIRTALDEGETFEPELVALRKFGGGDPTVAAAAADLAPLSAHGTPSLTILKREFAAAAKKVVEAEEALAPTWYERQIASAQALFGWGAPASGPSAADLVRAALGRSAVAITAGNFVDAVTDLRTIPTPGAPLLESWIAMATQRIAAERALQEIGGAAVAQLTAAGG